VAEPIIADGSWQGAFAERLCPRRVGEAVPAMSEIFQAITAAKRTPPAEVCRTATGWQGAAARRRQFPVFTFRRVEARIARHRLTRPGHATAIAGVHRQGGAVVCRAVRMEAVDLRFGDDRVEEREVRFRGG